MDNNLLQELKKVIKGDVLTDAETLITYSHDASLFEIKPQAIVFPKNEDDVKAIIKFANLNKKNNPSLSLTARSAGTDMSGGSINDSIIVAFEKYFNNAPRINNNIATTQPGVYYRDFEKETLGHDLIFPSYPASREICAMGGIVNNNSGGEKSLQYGKTEKYVKRIKAVLSDGNTYEFKKLNKEELEEKMSLKTFEGEIYRKIYKLINDNYTEIMNAKPQVSKNSAGYFLWNVYDKEKETFDLTKLFVGAQGTLGFLLEADIELVPIHKHREMLIIFLHDLSHLSEIAKQLGLYGMIQASLAFLPAFISLFTGRNLPKLVLQVDFTSNDVKEIEEKVATLKAKLKPLNPQTQIAKDNAEKRYWLVRRESFNLLRKKIRDKHTAPFIDDFVIKPECIEEVVTQITDILKKHPEFIYTVAGHVGDGNFHIIPLVDIADPKVRNNIPIIAKEVYDLIHEYHGSITGEHNDGLIRTPYLQQMYGEKIISLFEETKQIFDPNRIFNPRKKVFGDLDYAMSHIRQNW